MANELFQVEDVSKVYEEGGTRIHLFKGLSFSVAHGESWAIIGASGIGKSTLLHLMSGLDYVTQGRILCEGQDLGQMSERALSWFRGKHFGFVFQHHFLLNDFNALENALLPVRILGLPLKEGTARAERLLAEVGLQDRKRHYPQQLSGGERQRVAIIRALVHEPLVIFADEPTGNLDRDNAKVVEELLFSLAERESRALLLSTHDRNLTQRAMRSLDLGSTA